MRGFILEIFIAEINDEETKKKQTIDFLISPTTHLFPLSSQSRSHRVSIKVTLILKYGIYDKVIKLYYSTSMKLI